jgi:hypothetical protein
MIKKGLKNWNNQKNGQILKQAQTMFTVYSNNIDFFTIFLKEIWLKIENKKLNYHKPRTTEAILT